jgi:hypothetical protein
MYVFAIRLKEHLGRQKELKETDQRLSLHWCAVCCRFCVPSV